MKSIGFICLLLLISANNTLSQWTPLPTGNLNNYLTDVHFISADTGWVVGKGPAMLKTTDGGQNWIQQETPGNTDISSVFFLDGMNGWAGRYNGGILKTSNGGATWILQNSGTENVVSQIKFSDLLNGTAVIGQWNYSPRFGVILRTTDGGSNWVHKVYVNGAAFIDLDFFDADNGWAVGTNGLFYRTTNGGISWIGPEFITDHWLHDVHFVDKYIGYAVGGTSSNDIILKTTNSGLSWTVVRQSFNNRLLAGCYFVSVEKGWAVGLDGTILMTTNGGISWIRQETNVPSLFHDVYMIDTTGYAVSELGKIYKYNHNYQIPLTLTRPNGGEIWYAGTQEKIYWADSDSANVTIEYSIGSGWNLIVANYPNTGEYEWTAPNINSNQALIKINKFDNNGIYDISDYPFSIRSYIPVELTSFEASIHKNQILLRWSTATETNNMGFEIQRSVDNIDFLTIDFLEGFGSTAEPKHYLFVDNYNLPGVCYYRLKQVDLDGTFSYSNTIELEIIQPIEYILEQNYPNPFNPTTEIKYSLPTESHVLLKIYNINAQLIHTLVNENQPAGKYSIKFEATNLPSGTYFYRIQTGSFVETKKMVLLK